MLFGKRRAYQRKVAVAEFNAVVSGDIYVFAPKNGRMLPELLPFLCMSERFFQHAVGTSAGSLSPRTNWSSLSSFEFDIPPLDQQRRIAEIFWVIDEVCETYDNQLSAIRDYQTAYWTNHIFSAGVESVPIREVADVVNGSTPSRNEDRFWQNGTIPWLPTGKVHDRFICKADEFITEAALKARKARVFPHGSVLVAMIGQGKTRGAAALLEIDASINQNFACIIPQRIDSQYLFYALDFSYSDLRRSAHGSNQEALNCNLVADFHVHTTSLAEQAKIGSRLRAYDDYQKQLRSHAEMTRKLRDKISNRLFS
jgi:type I restriction enzyme S subunit